MPYDLTLIFRKSKSGYYKMAIFMAGKFDNYTPAVEDKDLNKVEITLEELKDKYHFFDALWGFAEHWVGTRVFFNDVEYTKDKKLIRPLVRAMLGLDKTPQIYFPPPKDQQEYGHSAKETGWGADYPDTDEEIEQHNICLQIMKLTLAHTEWKKAYREYKRSFCHDEEWGREVKFWKDRVDRIITKMAGIRKIRFSNQN